jgi:hypothetical protein
MSLNRDVPFAGTMETSMLWTNTIQQSSSLRLDDTARSFRPDPLEIVHI